MYYYAIVKSISSNVNSSDSKIGFPVSSDKDSQKFLPDAYISDRKLAVAV